MPHGLLMESRARRPSPHKLATLEVLNRPLQCPRDFLGAGFWRKPHGLADANLNFSGRGELLPRVLDLKQTISPHRQDGNTQIVGKEADSGAERAEFAVLGVLPLRKHEHAVAAISGLSGVG